MLEESTYAVLDTYRKAGAFGLLCASRLAILGEAASSPVTSPLDRVVQTMAGLRPGLAPNDMAELRRYFEGIPVLDDVDAPVYYACTAVQVALTAVSNRSQAPQKTAIKIARI